MRQRFLLRIRISNLPINIVSVSVFFPRSIIPFPICPPVVKIGGQTKAFVFTQKRGKECIEKRISRSMRGRWLLVKESSSGSHFFHWREEKKQNESITVKMEMEEKINALLRTSVHVSFFERRGKNVH